MPDRPKVLIADPIHEDAVALIGQRSDVIQLGWSASEEEKNQAALDADVVVVRLFKITERLLAQTPKLRAVIKHGIGVDNIDIPACTRHGVLVANTPGGSNPQCVAEGAVTLLLAALRRVRPRHQAIVDGKFMEARHSPVTGSLWGKTVGIVGLGQIGQYAAKIFHGFSCEILAFDPWASDEAFHNSGAVRVRTLAELLLRSDAISIHAPLTKETRHLIGAEELARMKPGAVIVNTSRGGIVDENALADALSRGVIAGAGIDAFEREPPEPSSPLLSAPNIVLSPHVTGTSLDSLRELGMAVVAALTEALDDRMPPSALNKEAWTRR